MRGVGRLGVRIGRLLLDASIFRNLPCVRCGIAYHLREPTLGAFADQDLRLEYD